MTKRKEPEPMVRMPAGVALWPIGKLSPYFRNPRTHTQDQVTTMARLMRRFGWTDPIVVDEASGILAGHLRYAAALHMGLKEVPVVEVTHLTEEEKRAFVIGHNAIALKSGWDRTKLAEELGEVADDELLVLAGFTEEELERLEREMDQEEQEERRPFNPNLDPDMGAHQYGPADMEAAQDELRGAAVRRDHLTKAMCPQCHHEFYLSGSGSTGGSTGNG